MKVSEFAPLIANIGIDSLASTINENTNVIQIHNITSWIQLIAYTVTITVPLIKLYLEYKKASIKDEEKT